MDMLCRFSISFTYPKEAKSKLTTGAEPNYNTYNKK